MDKFVVNKDSWHYRMNVRRLRDSGNYFQEELDNIMEYNSNFCAYWRMTLMNVLGIVFMISLAIGIVALILVGVYKLFVFFTSAASAEILGVVIFISIFAAIIIGSFFAGKYFDKRKKKLREIAHGEYEEPQKSIFVAKYMSWKQKICPKVEYK